MNKVILMGRLTRDPEVRYSQGESPMAIARFSLAVDRRGRSNSTDGQTVYTTEVVAEDQEFAESKNASSGSEGGFAGNNNNYSRPVPSGAADGFMNIPDGIDEELPFN